MFYRFNKKRSNYPGRWFVKLVQFGLIFGIVLFGLDALNNTFVPAPDVAESAVVSDVQSQDDEQPYTIRIEPIEVERTHSDAEYHFMALSHQQRGEYMEAILDYNRALQLNADRPASRLNRGVAFEQLNQADHAVYDFNAYMNRDNVTRVSANPIGSNYNVELEMAESRVYEFPFYAVAGQTVDVSVTSIERAQGLAVDPLIVIIDADGRPVAGDDDILRQDGSLIAMDSAIEGATLADSGRYTLRVSHAGGNSYGQLELDFALNSASNTSMGYMGCGGAAHGSQR